MARKIAEHVEGRHRFEAGQVVRLVDGRLATLTPIAAQPLPSSPATNGCAPPVSNTLDRLRRGLVEERFRYEGARRRYEVAEAAATAAEKNLDEVGRELDLAGVPHLEVRPAVRVRWLADNRDAQRAGRGRPQVPA
jgi:hypothetical protein